MRCPNHLMIIAVILFSALQSLHATTPETCLLFSITSQNTARLGIVNTSRKTLALEITNSEGKTFFSKSIQARQNYFQLFNLAELPDGEYKVKLSNFEQTEEKKFQIRNTMAEVIKEEAQQEPSFYLLDDKTLIVSYFNKDGGPVNIFFMVGDEVVFEERGLTERALSKKYSLKQLPGGEYSVRMYASGKTYTYPLVIY